MLIRSQQHCGGRVAIVLLPSAWGQCLGRGLHHLIHQAGATLRTPATLRWSGVVAILEVPWALRGSWEVQGKCCKEWLPGFPGGAVVENLPANAGHTGSSPGLGRSHMPRSN